MRVIKKCISFIFLLLTISVANGQELKCTVKVTAKDEQESDRNALENLRKSVEQFMNSQVWTDNVFDEKEKIDVNILISVKQKSNDVYDASLQIQSNRPSYNSRYQSIMLNFIDEKLKFTFQEFGTIEFDEQTFNSNLTYVLAFYAYVIIGLDYDSFSLNGGTKWYQKAEAIVNNAQTQNDYSGWKAFESKDNKYWIIENLINNAYSGFRTSLYTYHRLGLDIMSEKPQEGRAKISEALSELEKVHNQKPGTIILTVFFQAKSKEIINIYSEAQADEKSRITSLLKKMDPGRASDYDKILSQK